jgi:hypothetical protein
VDTVIAVNIRREIESALLAIHTANASLCRHSSHLPFMYQPQPENAAVRSSMMTP